MLHTILFLTLLAPATNEAATMSAIRIHEFGGPEALTLEQAPKPSSGARELLVRVHAPGVNPVDTGIRSGRAAGLVGANLPYTPGFDVSGVVEHVGDGVTSFKPGDEVYAMIDLRRGGAYAEYAIVKQDEAALKPKTMTHTEAAGVPLVALTAWQALFETADLKRGQTVLIHAGAGGVGSHAIQLAKWKGAIVIATASASNHVYLKELGADQVIDYRTQRFEEVVKNVDVVLDPVAGDTQTRSFGVLKKGGVLVSLLGQPAQDLARQHEVRAVGILVHPSSDQLEQIATLIDDGHVRPVVTHVFPLAEAAKAHEQSETRHTRGKIVLEVIEAPTTRPATERE